MNWAIETLPWLPAPPADFRERCRTLSGAPGQVAAELQRLAGFRLNASQLDRLARTLDAVGGAEAFPACFRLGVLSDATTDLLLPALRASAARHGVWLEVGAAPFNQVAQTAFDPASPFLARKWDAILVSVSRHGLSKQGSAFDDLVEIRAGLARGNPAPVIFETVARSPLPFFGSFDRKQADTETTRLDDLNRRLAIEATSGTDLLLDTAGLAEVVGAQAWDHPGQWHMAKLPFSQTMVPLWADHVVRLIAAIRGRSRKCLVLDLDNTLWGGVVGDDGVDGIRLGQGDPVGESFLAVQAAALALRQRGILLAVCSKNTEEAAREPFRRHDSMLLREEHIAAFVANWTDKAANLEAIARMLEIGLDSLVFLDDNPVERAQVRETLPAIAVPELPDDPALYPRALAWAGYFEAVAYSEDDRRRAEQYQANSERNALKVVAHDLDGFLRSLEMKITFRPFDAMGRGRIAQLINKSNQFNLTTRRYSEAEVAAMEADPGLFTLQVALVDRFGDNGMISVLICRDAGSEWEIDTWLMSCRVLGRCVEAAVLKHVADHARAAGKTALTGRFIPSGRNELVREHYHRLGFEEVGGMPDGQTFWRLRLDRLNLPDLPFSSAGSPADTE